MAWSVTSKARNIHLIECSSDIPSTEWEQWILLTADRHLDNPHSDMGLQRRHLDMARERNAAVIDVGDLFCAMGGKYDPRSSKHGVTRPEHQIANDYLDSIVRANADFIAPYADLFAVIARGNHETGILKRNETDLTERLCERIHAKTGKQVYPGGYGGWIVFRYRYHTMECTTSMKYFHGAGGGAMMSFGTLDVRRRLSWTPDADIVVGGHNHNQWMVRVGRERLIRQNNVCRVGEDSVLWLNCPSYKDEYADGHEGWAIERGHPPKPLGAWWLRLHIVRRVEEAGPRRLRMICTPTPTETP